jgi:uncharacterized membrane protein YoaK (UPF0700 family)
MTALIVFTLALAAAAIIDLRAMRRAGQKREIAAYILMCAAAFALAAWYFPAPLRRSIMEQILRYVYGG